LISEYGINPQLLANMPAPTLQSFYNNLQQSANNGLIPFAAIYNVMINPDNSNPLYSSANVVNLLNNQQKLAYMFTQFA